MRRLLLASAAFLVTACGGQTTDPCVMKLDVRDVPTLQINAIAQVHADLSAKSGSCSSTLKAGLSWSSSNTNTVSLLLTTDTAASIKGLNQGSALVTAWITQIPSIRDSTSVSVAAPVDTAR